MASQRIYIEIPGSDTKLYPGYKIKLNRFDSDIWTVHYGWYDFSGNRPIMGWYLTNDSDSNSVKPIQKIDLYDIYVVDTSNKEDVDVETIQSDYAQSNPLEPSYIKNRPFYEDTLDSIDTAFYDNTYEEFIEGSEVIHQWTFSNMSADIELQTEYTLNYTVDGELASVTATPMIPTSDVMVLADSVSEPILIVGGKVAFDSGTLLYVPESNTISICYISEIKPNKIGVSIADVPFKHIKKLPEESTGNHNYRYVVYPEEYMAFNATGLSETSVMVSIGVPVGSINDSGRIVYIASNGIRMGTFSFGGTLPHIMVYVDMFPKDQEWELWTLNTEEEDGSFLRISVPMYLTSAVMSDAFAEHIRYCSPMIKVYSTKSLGEQASVWAAYQVTVCLDSAESASEYIEYINSRFGGVNSTTTYSLTARVRDIDYEIEPVKIIDYSEGEGDGE